MKINNKVPMHSPIRRRSVRRQAGLSLLEVLFAAVLVSAVAVSLAPLFVRSVASNVHGDTSSRGLNNARSFTSVWLGLPKDHPATAVLDPGTPDPSATERKILDVYYDVGDPDRDGDERWLVSDPGGATDAYAFERRWDLELRVRDFSILDVSPHLISSADPSQLIMYGGHELIFDSPVPAGAASNFRHLKELTAEVKTRREGSSLGGQKITVRRFRSY